ncbi:MAG TPA: radical SAM protein, partial [Devosia sp.]|nr:radical SAM protein [Devosia sp.]
MVTRAHLARWIRRSSTPGRLKRPACPIGPAPLPDWSRLPVNSERSNGLFGIYVHWPFCLAKCPYCDFNSHVRHDPVDQKRFLTAYIRELEWFARHTSDRHVQSIFFGGGTPSLMEPETVAGILDAIARLWTIDPGVEITLEANPTSVEASRFK